MFKFALDFIFLVPLVVFALALIGQWWAAAWVAGAYWLAYRLVRHLLASVFLAAVAIGHGALYLLVAGRQFRAGRALRS